MHRLFIALPINSDVRTQLKPVTDHLYNHSTKLRIVPPDNYHITLKFLGECNDSLAMEIEKSFPEICPVIDEMPFAVSGLGAFPNTRRAKIIWAGLKMDERTIKNLYNNIFEFYSHLGFKEEEEEKKREFTPHLTLARVHKRERIGDGLSQYIEENSNKYFGASIFRKLVLYSSTLTPNGPIYTEIRSISFSSKEVKANQNLGG